ncbi:MAG: tetratricopeptide repeat protein [Nitrospirae bacterium]|nr:tetratricopeptide repeat protein [Nitrospirota bacterium]
MEFAAYLLPVRPLQFHSVPLRVVSALLCLIVIPGTAVAVPVGVHRESGGQGQESPLSAVSLPPAVVADEPLPDGGPRFDQPIYAPGSLPFREALAALEQRAYPAAVTAFQRVIEKFPQSPLAAASEAFLAEIHVMKALTPQSRADAIGQYRHLAVSHPDSPNALRAYWRMGDLYAGMGLYPEAQGAYARLLAEGQAGRDVDRALLGSGVNKLHWGKGEGAAADFEALRRRTHDEQLLRYASIGLADALALQQRYGEAKSLYEAEFRSWPEELKRHPLSFLSFAHTYSALGLETDARRLYEMFYNLDPTHRESGVMLVRIGDSFLRERHGDRAVLFYRHVLQLHANTEASDLAYLRLAQISAELLKRDRDHSLALQVKGLMDATSGPVLDESQQEIVYRAIAIDRSESALGSEALFRLGQHHELMGNLTMAVTVYRDLRQRQGQILDDQWPEKATTRLKEILGSWIIGALQGRDDVTAVRLFRLPGEDAERLFSDSGLIVGVAGAHQRLGLTPEAVRLYQVALKQNLAEQTLEAALLGLGQTYAEQGDAAAARQVFQRYRLPFPLASRLRFARLWLRDFPRDPEQPQVMLSLAEGLVRTGEFEDAARAYADIERTRLPIAAATWLHHGDMLSKAGQLGEAAKRYQSVLWVKPSPEEEAWARVRLASVWRQMKRFTAAAAVLAPVRVRVRNGDPLLSRFATALERDLDREGG